MKAALLLSSTFSAALLCSCDVVSKITAPGEYHPEYLNEGSALDGVGAEAARAAQRNNRVQEGTFAPGDTLDVHESKVYLFSRNPDKDEKATGKMVNTDKAKIIACEGLYYFVEVDDGSKGFLRESDLVNPVKLVSTNDNFLLPNGETPGPEGWAEGDVTQPDVLQLDSNQTLMTNANGRTVVVVGKKSEKSDDFEARKKALLEGKSAPKPDIPAPAPAYEDLPEPTAGY